MRDLRRAVNLNRRSVEKVYILRCCWPASTGKLVLSLACAHSAFTPITRSNKCLTQCVAVNI